MQTYEMAKEKEEYFVLIFKTLQTIVAIFQYLCTTEGWLYWSYLPRMFYILYIDELMKRILFYVFTTIIFLLAFADVASAQSKHYYERMREFRQRHDIDGSTIVMFGNSLTEKAGNWTASV